MVTCACGSVAGLALAACGGSKASGPPADASAGDGNPLSTGCGVPWTGATGKWVQEPATCGLADQAECQAIPPGTAPSFTPDAGDPEWRGWWIWVPSDYDPDKPGGYPVVYESSPGGDEDAFAAGQRVYGYDADLAGGEGGADAERAGGPDAILVGLDDADYSQVENDPDQSDPVSNDFLFVPWLMSNIESELCVDRGRESFVSQTSIPGSVADQMSCALPDRLRAAVDVEGTEPAQQPACVHHPIAAMFVHDTLDTSSPYAGALTACTRILGDNGCTVTDCADPTDPTKTTPYAVPADVTVPAGAQCRAFDGCPADDPVVFCTTTGTPFATLDVEGLTWGFLSGLRSIAPE